MKISNSKKELARIISENGGWFSGTAWAVQNGEHGRISFSGNKPVRHGDKSWMAGGGFQFKIEVCKPLRSWHQCILSREEYFHLYPTKDDDGWIECNGSEPQIDQDAVVEVKFRDGQLGHNPETVRVWCWTHGECDDDIIAYRLHKPEQAKHEFCESVTRSIPEPESKPTIEQLAADYRNRKDYADRKQEEADAAKADAEAKLEEPIAAGDAIGLVVSVAWLDPEPVITDWRDLQVGDEIEYVKGTSPHWNGRIGVVEQIDEDGEYNILFRIGNKGDEEDPELWITTRWCSEFRFIRRP